MYTIVIIGAGFSGTATAAQLLRRHGNLPLNVVLINRHPNLGRGVAYGTYSPSHLLNVPAGRMSLFPDDDGDFLRFARTGDPQITGGSFVRRSLYGDYLVIRLHEAADKATRAKLDPTTGEVTGLQVAADGRRVKLEMADGSTSEADRVVLASGNYPPADPPLPATAVYASRGYVRDPWAAGALDAVRSDKPVFLIGTGLTMLDVALELTRHGFSNHMFALSRRGLLPQGHRHEIGSPLEPRVVMDLLRGGPASIRRYLRVIRLCIAELAEQGIDWRDVIGALRPYTADLWQRLNLVERRRFLRHVQAYWDTHRHRTAPAAHVELQRLLQDGTLVVKAGRLKSLTATQDDLITVRWTPRGVGNDARVDVGVVINCTGPQSRLQALPDPLIRSLLRQGVLVPDALELGLLADDNGALISREGNSSESIFYTGPFLKARDWECTAVPELGIAAAKLADHLVAPLSTQPAQVA